MILCTKLVEFYQFLIHLIRVIHFESSIESFDKTNLHLKYFNNAECDEALLITHGLGEHSGCYYRLAEGLKELPLSVVAFDLRGHGRSGGQRGYVKSFDDFIGDFCAVYDSLRKQKYKKIHLLAHSMGALVLLNSLADLSQDKIGKIALSSPFLDVGLEIPAVKKIAADVLKNFLGRFTVDNEISNDKLSSDLDVQREYIKDPYRHQKISFTLFNDFFRYFSKAAGSVVQIQQPLLVQYAGLDQVVSNKKIEDLFFERKNTLLIKYEKSQHEIFNDIERQQVYKDLIQFIRGSD